MTTVAQLRTRGRAIRRSHPVQDVALGLLASLAGVWILTQVFPGVPLHAGSVTLRVTVVPALTGGLTIQAPPLGDLSADSFVGPARVVARTGSVDVGAVDSVLRGESRPEIAAPDTVDLARAVGSAILLDAAAAAAFGALVALTLRRERARVLRVSATGAAVVIVVGFLGLLTHDPAAYDAPRRTGAWAALPELSPETLSQGRIGGALGDQLVRFGSNLTGFYAALAADARASGLRGDSEVVLVVPDGLPPDTRAAAMDWFDPDRVTGPAGATAVTAVTVTDDGLLLPDGRAAPLGVGTAGEQTPDRFVVLYVDPDTAQLRAVDLVTVDEEGATLQRLAVDPGAEP